VMALLLRFYAASAGTITIDGHAIDQLDPSWLRVRMAYVQQEPVLFGMSIQENVLYGLTAQRSVEHAMEADAAADLALVHEACAAANAHSFISSFASGYETIVGERGSCLSGGQKQRLAIARALLTKPRVLLLDEATSALDAESELLVQQALDRLAHGRTVLMIAHRLSTVRDADQIALVANGSVADVGQHADLLARCSAYRTLVSRQMHGAESPSESPPSPGRQASREDERQEI